MKQKEGEPMVDRHKRIRRLVQRNFRAEQLEAEPRAETQEEKRHTAETFKQYAEKIRSAIKQID